MAFTLFPVAFISSYYFYAMSTLSTFSQVLGPCPPLYRQPVIAPSCNALIPTNFVVTQRSLMNTTLMDICATSCSPSLLSFQMAVESACGDTPYKFHALSNSTVSSTADKHVRPVVWAHNVTCLQDGLSFCYAEITNGLVTACSNCLLSYEATMLGSVYWRGRVDIKRISSQLSSCGVPASEYPYTSPTDGSTATST